MEIPLTFDNVLANRLSDSFFMLSDNGRGIFASEPMQAAPWVGDDDYPISPDSLDLVYFFNRSGEKFPSPLVTRLADEDGVLSQQAVNKLGQIIMELYGPMFAKQWATLKLQYNPIENYSMLEVESTEGVTAYGKTRTESSRNAHDKTGTTTTTPNTHEIATIYTSNTTAGEATDKVAGFNTTALTNRGGQETSEESTGRETRDTSHSGSEQVAYLLNDTVVGSKTDSDGGRDTQTGERTLTRSGNIGVTTSQQMVQSERDLWQWNYIEQVVFPAVDEILAMKIY